MRSYPTAHCVYTPTICPLLPTSPVSPHRRSEAPLFHPLENRVFPAIRPSKTVPFPLCSRLPTVSAPSAQTSVSPLRHFSSKCANFQLVPRPSASSSFVRTTDYRPFLNGVAAWLERRTFVRHRTVLFFNWGGGHPWTFAFVEYVSIPVSLRDHIATAKVTVSVDESYKLLMNDQVVTATAGSPSAAPITYDVLQYLNYDDAKANILRFDATNQSGPGGLAYKLEVTFK